MIQIVGERSYHHSFQNNKDIDISRFSAPKSFDMYDINIIDFQSDSIWRSDKNDVFINSINDIQSIITMMTNSKKAKFVVCLPLNHIYTKISNYGIKSETYLKDIINSLNSYLLNPFCKGKTSDLEYENTQTAISGVEYNAAFYLFIEKDAITKSIKSEKNTTRYFINTYYTTLNIINNFESLIVFLRGVGCFKETINHPEWVDNIVAFDDIELRMKIDDEEKAIEKSQGLINKAIDKLAENMKYKSILYTTGGGTC